MLVLKIIRIPEEPSFGALSIPLSVTDYINSAKGKARSERAAGMILLRDTLKGMGIGDFGIEILPSGKPVLTHPNLYFSISHAGGLCALAISDSPVGIDLQDTETVAKISNQSSFARRYFSQEEYNAYFEEPTTEQICRIWTRKEALCKLLGKHLSSSLSSLSSFDFPDVVFETRRASLEKEFFLTIAKEKADSKINNQGE